MSLVEAAPIKVQPPAVSQAIFEAANLSKELQQLTVGERFLITEIEPGKLVLRPHHYSSSHQCLATVCFLENGDMILSDGRPSANGVRIMHGQELRNSHIFPEQVSLTLAKEETGLITLPGNILSQNSQNPNNQICTDLHGLKIGESLTIGRNNYKHLSATVSRKHLVIQRLADITTDQHQTRMYLVHDGFPSENGVFINDSNNWHKVRGSIQLAPGRQFSLGNPAQNPSAIVAEVPEPLKIERAANPHSQMLHTRHFTIGDISKMALAHQAAADQQMHSIFMPSVNPATIQGHLDDLKKIRAVGIQLRKGLKLIANGEYKEAMDLFQDTSALSSCFPNFNFHTEPARTISLNSLEAKDVVSTLQLIAGYSWFKISGNDLSIAPCLGVINQNIQAKSPIEHTRLKKFRHEVALIYAEEFTHAYQHALGGMVSRHGVFLKNDSEGDVAQLFRDYGVKMSRLFVKRYGREETLERTQGIQTKEEQQIAKDRLAQLRPDQDLQIGWKMTTSKEKNHLEFQVNDHHIQDKNTEPLGQKELSPIRAQLRREVMETDSKVVNVKRLPDGTFLIKPIGKFLLYSQDSYGIWRGVPSNRLLLESGKFRIGMHFEVELP